MPKSKHTRKDKHRAKRGPTPLQRSLARQGLQLRSFEIRNEIDETYAPGIPDEIAEATIKLQQGRVEEAKAAFERIIEREPRAREAYMNLAAAYAFQGDEATAEAMAWQIIEKFPTYPLPRINIAKMYLSRGQIEEARDMLLPLDNVNKFTFGEFQNYALAWSDLMQAEGNSAAAQSWQKMLLDVMAKAPGLFE